jgi:hypothetical protein
VAKYRVTALGCDGATVVVLELTDTERETLERLAAATAAASESACEPVVRIAREETDHAE